MLFTQCTDDTFVFYEANSCEILFMYSAHLTLSLCGVSTHTYSCATLSPIDFEYTVYKIENRYETP
jgi:hypothetical protein